MISLSVVGAKAEVVTKGQLRLDDDEDASMMKKVLPPPPSLARPQE